MKKRPLTKADLNKTLNKLDQGWDKKLALSFQKQDAKWDKKLDKKLEALKKEIISSTALFFHDTFIPILDRIEDKLDLTGNIVDNHERRIEKLEDKVLYL